MTTGQILKPPISSRLSLNLESEICIGQKKSHQCVSSCNKCNTDAFKNTSVILTSVFLNTDVIPLVSSEKMKITHYCYSVSQVENNHTATIVVTGTTSTNV